MADLEREDAPQSAEDESQQNETTEPAPEGAVESEKTSDKPESSKTPEGKEKGKQADDSSQYVTPQVLQGVLAAQQRSQQADIGKTIEGLEDKIGELTSSFESTLTHQLEAQKESESSENAELIDLRRKSSDHESELQTLRNKLGESEKREADFRFETSVKDALAKNGCLKPNHVFRMIAPDLEYDKDRNKVYASIEGEYGREELSVEEYVKRVVKEDTIPELFKASMRMGSPASGDKNNSGGERYMFTKEQIENPDFYAKNADKIRDALDKGLVKGIASK